MTLVKAKLTNSDTNEQFECLFNPNEYSIRAGNEWASTKVIGRRLPKLEFTGGKSSTLTLTLFFDVNETPRANVRSYTSRLMKLTEIVASTKDPTTGQGRPPICLFQWGGIWSFKAVVKDIDLKFTLFREDGTPVRATAALTFLEVIDAAVQEPTNPSSYAERGYKRHRVQPHETLALIAYENYGDAGKWRRIADANNLGDPLRLQTGQILAIPPLIS